MHSCIASNTPFTQSCEMDTSHQITAGTEEDLNNGIYLSPCDNMSMAKQSQLEFTSAEVGSNVQLNQLGNTQTMTVVQVADDFNQNGQMQQIVHLIPQTLDDHQLLLSQSTPKYSLASSVADIVSFSQNGGQSLPIVDGHLSVIESEGQQYLLLPSFSVVPEQQIVLQNRIPVIQEQMETVEDANPQSQMTSLQPVRTQETEKAAEIGQGAVVDSDTANDKHQGMFMLDQMPVPPKEMSGTLMLEGSIFHYPDGVQQKMSKGPSKLNMLDIIPSLYRRTIQQDKESPAATSCEHCSFRSENKEEIELHREKHRSKMVDSMYNTSIKKSRLQSKRRRRGRFNDSKTRKMAQMIRTEHPSGAAASSEALNFPMNCVVCKVEITTQAQYKRHLKQHANDKPFRCEKCGETFNKEHNLNLHNSLHVKTLPNGELEKYQCPECKKTFSRMASLKMHISMHAEEETFMCKECGDEFNLSTELATHISEHRKDLARHLHDKGKGVSVLLQTTDDEERVTDRAITVNIEELPDNFGEAQSQLMQHIHNTAPQDSLENAPSDRARQRTTQENPGPHQCRVCGKCFQRKSQLTRHNRIHTGEKPYICPVCAKAFNQKGAMQTHMSMHIGEKPYVCPHCPQSYTQRGNLKIHVTRVHSATTNDACFACHLCPCVFKKLGSLNAHMTKYHPNQDMSEVDVIKTILNDRDKVTQLVEATNDGASENLQKFLQNVLNQKTIVVETDENADDQGTDIVHRALEECVGTSMAESSNKFPDLGDLQLPLDPFQNTDNNSGTIDIELSTEQQVVDTERSGLSSTQGIQSVVESPETRIDTDILKENGSSRSQVENLSDSISTHSGLLNSNETCAPMITNSNIPSRNTNKNPLWKVRRSAGIRWHQCMFCTKEFRKPSDLVRHIRVHTLERPYKCKQCYRAFTVKSSLTTHVKTHLGIKAYRCQVCLKSFTTAGSLKVHLRMHTGSKPFSCPHCDRRFRTTGHRTAHIGSHFKKQAAMRPVPPKKVASRKTLLDFSQYQLQSPLLITETGIVRTLATKGNDSVLFRNDPDRPFKCDKCNKAFKKSSHLKQHIRSHTGEKPYTCNQCKRSFISTGILKAHMKTHLGINAYRCNLCMQAFSTNGSLKRHALTHSDSRPFMCPYCRKTFKTLVNCRKHIKTHRPHLGQQNPSGTVVHVQSASSGSNIHSDIDPNASTVSGLPSVEDTLGNSYITNFTGNDSIVDSSPKTIDSIQQVDHSMVQEMTSMQQNQSYYLSPQGSGPGLQLQGSGQLSLEDLAGLSLPQDATNLNLGNQSIMQMKDLALFDFETMAPHDENVGLNVSVPQPLYPDNLGLLENIEENAQIPVAPTTSTAPSQPDTSQIQATQQEANITATQFINKTTSSPQPHRTRNKSFGAKQMKVNLKQVLQCMGCEGVFKPEEFEEHSHGFESAAKDLPFACTLCCHRFERGHFLKDHMDFHSTVSGVVYKCMNCGVGFVSKNIVEDHRKLHKDNAMRPPVAAPKDFNSTTQQTKLGTPHAPKSRGRSSYFRLTEEQSLILSQTNPNLHMTLSERVLLSAVAEKDRIVDTIVSKRGRRKELEVNGPIHPNACTQCQKSFQKKNDLVRHIRTHTGDRPYSCEQCGKSFSVKSILISHMKTHTGVKPFRCHICDLLYATKTSLKVHMRLHTGGTPYKCPQCPLRFRTSGHRKNHMKSHSNKNALKKNNRTLKKGAQTHQSNLQSKSQPIQQTPMIQFSDVTLTLPENVLNSGILQNDGLQLQWNGQNLQLVTSGGVQPDNENISLQIDPVMFSQSLMNQAQTSTQDVVKTYTQSTTSGPPPNLVIQPITIQDGYARDQSQFSVGTPAEQMNSHEINVAVPASLASITQQLFQSPTNTVNQSNTEASFTFNNPGMLQAIQQMLNSSTTNTSSSSSGLLTDGSKQSDKPDMVAPDLTLAVNQDDLLSSQPFTFDMLQQEDVQTSSNQHFTLTLGDNNILATSSS